MRKPWIARGDTYSDNQTISAMFLSPDYMTHEMSRNDEEMISSPLLNESASAGCEESQMLVNRRALLGVSAGLFSWASLPKGAAAAVPAQRRLLVVVLRGGVDGLHVAYRPEEKSLLDGYRADMFSGKGDYLSRNYTLLSSTVPSADASAFKLHNNLTNFRGMYRTGEAALIHAIAPPLRTRSHFDCQANMESGQPGIRNINNEGWLNRFLQGLMPDQALDRSLAVNNVPLLMKGAAEVQSWTYTEMQNYGDVFLNKFVADYSSKPAWQKNLRGGLDLNTKINGRTFDRSALTMPFSVAGMLMSEADGPRVAVLSVDGLDTHSDQLSVLDRKLLEFDTGLGAFKTAMTSSPGGTDAWRETIVVCVTEFGRSLRDNSSGTDHGVGTVAFLAGGNVEGGRVVSDWPGIATANLQDGAD